MSGKRRRDRTPERVHVVPVFADEPEHGERDCWCDPELDFRDPETGGEVWLHRRTQ